MKNWVSLTLALVLAVGISLFSQKTNPIRQEEKKVGPFQQVVTRLSSKSHTNYEVYKEGQLIGVLSSKKLLKDHLKQIYQTQYEKEYPNSSCDLGKGYFLLEKESYEFFENRDQELLDYLDQANQYTLKVKAISFEKEGKEYAKIFVKNEDLYKQAFREFLNLFVDEESLKTVQNSNDLVELSHYGRQITGLSIKEKVRTYDSYAPLSEIKKTKEEVLEYLRYGDNTNREFYTVKEYDTVEGVGAQNHGLSAEQVMNLNKNQISNVDQALQPGQKLNVTYFSSPLNIVVYKKSLQKLSVDFQTDYVQDPNLPQGSSEVRKPGKNGLKNSIFEETWINGVLSTGKEKSYKLIQQPENALVAVGTKASSGVGTGVYRPPTDNAKITCHWGCYYGHRGVDFIDQYDRWGSVHAADNGVIKVNSTRAVSGNYVIIDHQNGYESYYGHLRVNSPLAVGTIVNKGDVIGSIGMTGLATGPHVHFYVTKQSERKLLNVCDGLLDCSGY